MEAQCPLNTPQDFTTSIYNVPKSNVHAVVYCVLFLLFKSSNINLINDSRYYFNFELLSELLVKRKDKFIEKCMASESLFDYFAIQ